MGKRAQKGEDQYSNNFNVISTFDRDWWVEYFSNELTLTEKQLRAVWKAAI